MPYRKLIYTGLTRARNLAVLVGTRRALSMVIKQKSTEQRQTALEELLSKRSSMDDFMRRCLRNKLKLQVLAQALYHFLHRRQGKAGILGVKR